MPAYRPPLRIVLAVAVVVGFALGALFDRFALGDRWRIVTSPSGFTYRVDAVTGYTTVLNPARGWVEIPSPPPPFHPAAPESTVTAASRVERP